MCCQAELCLVQHLSCVEPDVNKSSKQKLNDSILLVLYIIIIFPESRQGDDW